MEKIVEAFKTYQSLIHELHKLYFQYIQLFNQLNRQCILEATFGESVPEEEKSQTDDNVVKLEEDIQKIKSEISKHLQFMEFLLKRENVALQERAVFHLNRSHISTMVEYQTCITQFKNLQIQYEDYDFSKIDLYSLEVEKTKLNIAIKEYNDKNLRLMDYKLYDISELLAIAKEESNER